MSTAIKEHVPARAIKKQRQRRYRFGTVTEVEQLEAAQPALLAVQGMDNMWQKARLLANRAKGKKPAVVDEEAHGEVAAKA